MNINILQKFLEKDVMVYINGISHVGRLADCPNEGVMLLEHRTSKYLDEYDKHHYGVMYVSTNSIDAIRECLPEPEFANSLSNINWEEERQKMRTEIEEDLASICKTRDCGGQICDNESGKCVHPVIKKC